MVRITTTREVESLAAIVDQGNLSRVGVGSGALDVQPSGDDTSSDVLRGFKPLSDRDQ